MSITNSRNKNPFDDDDASAFMNSSASYLAADRLPDQEKDISPQEKDRNNLLQQINKVEQRTLESSKRSIGALIESEQIGIATAEDLSRQREQLENTEKNLDHISGTLKESQKSINGIKSVFSSLKQWWKTPKKGEAIEEEKSAGSMMTKSEDVAISHHLAQPVEHSQMMVGAAKGTHIALKLKGLEEEQDFSPTMNDVKAQSQKVNQQLDDDLTMMSSGLSRLKDLAKGLGNEIEDQNVMVDRIIGKSEKTGVNLTAQQQQVDRLVKK